MLENARMVMPGAVPALPTFYTPPGGIFAPASTPLGHGICFTGRGISFGMPSYSWR